MNRRAYRSIVLGAGNAVGQDDVEPVNASIQIPARFMIERITRGNSRQSMKKPGHYIIRDGHQTRRGRHAQTLRRIPTVRRYRIANSARRCNRAQGLCQTIRRKGLVRIAAEIAGTEWAPDIFMACRVQAGVRLGRWTNRKMPLPGRLAFRM